MAAHDGDTARTHLEQARQAWRRGEIATAVQRADSAAALAAAGDPALALDALELGMSLLGLSGRGAEIEPWLCRAAGVAEAAGDATLRARAALLAGNVHLAARRMPEAIAQYDAARGFTTDHLLVARIDARRGMALLHAGAVGVAVSVLARARRVLQRDGTALEAAMAASNAGVASMALGRPHEAAAAYREALATLGAPGTAAPGFAAMLVDNLAEATLQLGAAREAYALASEACAAFAGLELAREHALASLNQARAAQEIARGCHARREYADGARWATEADAALQRAADGLRHVDDDEARAWLGLEHARLLLDRGETVAAGERAADTLATMGWEASDPRRAPLAALRLDAASQEGDSAAIREAAEALARCAPAGHSVWECALALADARTAGPAERAQVRRRLDAALAEARAAHHDLAFSHRAARDAPRLRPVDEIAIALALADGDIAGVARMATAAKAAPRPARRRTTTARAHRAAIDTAAMRLRLWTPADGADARAAAWTALEEAERRFAAGVVAHGAAESARTPCANAAPVSRRPRRGELLLDYVSDGHRLSVLAHSADGVALHPAGECAAVDATLRDWEDEAADAASLNPQARARFAATLDRRMGDLAVRMMDLVCPAALREAVARAHRGLWISPWGPVARVPWLALRPAASHAPLGARVPLALVGTNAFPHTDAPRGGDRALIVAPDAGLEGSRREARRLARAWPGAHVLAGRHATRDAVLTAMRRARVAHFACHGTFRRDDPAFSALHLHGGALTLHDLRHAGVEGRTLILSACDGAGRDDSADAVAGLAAGCLAAGAATVVAHAAALDDADAARFRAILDHAARRRRWPWAVRAAVRAAGDAHLPAAAWAHLHLLVAAHETGRPAARIC